MAAAAVAEGGSWGRWLRLLFLPGAAARQGACQAGQYRARAQHCLNTKAVDFLWAAQAAAADAAQERITDSLSTAQALGGALAAAGRLEGTQPGPKTLGGTLAAMDGKAGIQAALVELEAFHAAFEGRAGTQAVLKGLKAFLVAFEGRAGTQDALEGSTGTPAATQGRERSHAALKGSVCPVPARWLERGHAKAAALAVSIGGLPKAVVLGCQRLIRAAEAAGAAGAGSVVGVCRGCCSTRAAGLVSARGVCPAVVAMKGLGSVPVALECLLGLPARYRSQEWSGVSENIAPVVER